MSEEIPDYDDAVADTAIGVEATGDDAGAGVQKGTYSTTQSSSFKDFLLKDNILHAIQDCGFEHPSEVQVECIPKAILGQDILCQAKSGMGKTAVFVLSCLQRIDTEKPGTDPKVLVVAPTRELAIQITAEFVRFSSHFDGITACSIIGGETYETTVEKIRSQKPVILVACPGRMIQLIDNRDVDLSKIEIFVLDECDRILADHEMRADMQKIFLRTPERKQVMMFTATLPQEIRTIARKYLKNPMEVFVDDESKLTLHGLLQHYLKIEEKDKNQRLLSLLDALQFNQVVIFVNKVQRADALNKFLNYWGFPSEATHGRLPQSERVRIYQDFKNLKIKILVASELFGRGIDIQKVNIVFNYDMPETSDAYLHRVGRAGRFGTKGFAISFVTEKDQEMLDQIQARFDVKITELPKQIDVDTYLNA